MLRNYLVSDRAQKIQRQLKIQYSDTLELKDVLLTTTLRSPRYYGPFFWSAKTVIHFRIKFINLKQ